MKLELHKISYKFVILRFKFMENIYPGTEIREKQNEADNESKIRNSQNFPHSYVEKNVFVSMFQNTQIKYRFTSAYGHEIGRNYE